MPRPDQEQPFYADRGDQMSGRFEEPSGPIAEEMEHLREKDIEKTEVLEDVEHTIEAMMSASDMPEEDVHVEQLEDILDRIQKMEF